MGIRIVQLFGATGPANQAANQPAIQLTSQATSQPSSLPARQPASPRNQPANLSTSHHSQPTQPSSQQTGPASQGLWLGLYENRAKKHGNSNCISWKHSQNIGNSNLPYENITKTLKIQIFVWKHNKHIENVNFQLLFIDRIFHSKFKLSNYLQQLGVSGKLWGPLATGCGEDCTIWLGNWDIHRKNWVIW